jgi:hypothetical protein
MFRFRRVCSTIYHYECAHKEANIKCCNMPHCWASLQVTLLFFMSLLESCCNVLFYVFLHVQKEYTITLIASSRIIAKHH